MSLEVADSRVRIDAHLHVWPNRATEGGKDADYTQSGNQGGGAPTMTATIEEYLPLMQAHGISKAVLVQPSHLGYDHGYLTRILRDHPGRFAGVGLIDPIAPDAADRLENLVREEGLSGIRLRPHLFRSYGIADQRSFPLWNKAAELKTPVCVYMEWTQAAGLERMLGQFPDVTVVIDHFGLPDLSPEKEEVSVRAVLRLGQYPNAYLKVSGQYGFSKSVYPYSNTNDLTRQALQSFGPSRMVWGTDFPLVLLHEGYDGALRLVRQHYEFLSDEERTWILGKTAGSLWSFR